MSSPVLIAWTVLVEAFRRKEIYAIVLISTLLIGAVATTQFFHLEGLGKFYREVALQIMTAATNITVIIIAARQLPREFETRTIYPLLAKPISRSQFMFGKLGGVMAAGAFCLLLFMVFFLTGSWYLHIPINAALFAQFLYLQILSMLIVSTMSFMLSLMTNLDAAITMGTLFYLMSAFFLGAATFLYPFSDAIVKAALKILVYVTPQLSLLDLSEKVVHQDAWGAIGASTISILTVYSVVFAAIFFGISYLLFRRRSL